MPNFIPCESSRESVAYALMMNIALKEGWLESTGTGGEWYYFDKKRADVLKIYRACLKATCKIPL